MAKTKKIKQNFFHLSLLVDILQKRNLFANSENSTFQLYCKSILVGIFLVNIEITVKIIH